MDKVSKEVRRVFGKLTKEYGDSPYSNSWDRAAQTFRWDKILELLLKKQKGRPFSILDFGCGTGDLYPYLVDVVGKDNFIYTGIDIVPEMVAIANKKMPPMVDRYTAKISLKSQWTNRLIGLL